LAQELLALGELEVVLEAHLTQTDNLQAKRTSSLGWRTGKRQLKLLRSNSNVETLW